MSDRVAILTPPGRSALATLAASGPGVWDIVRRWFRTSAGGELPEMPIAGRFWLGRLGADLADEVVLAVIETSPVRVEIHGHGGEEISRCLVELFTSTGATEVRGGEDLTPRPPLLRGEGEQEDHPAVCVTPPVLLPPLLAGEGGWGGEVFASRLLPHTTTTRTASIVLDQIAGAWTREIRAARLALESGRLAEGRAMIEALAARWHVGRHVVEPFRVVIAGAPNVGKSSLANALAGYQRSIVSPTPGTTRDLVTTSLAVDGWPIVLTDTAGLRLAGEDLEGRGIEQARGALAEADVCLWVVDASAPPVWPENGDRMHLVVNKIDLEPAWDATGVEALRVSATNGAGIADLLSALSRWLVPEVPPPGAGIPLTTAQAERLSLALREPERASAILAEFE